MRLCTGSTNVAFYSDLSDLKAKKNIKYKTIQSDRNFEHFLVMGSDKIYARVSNNKTDRSVYVLNMKSLALNSKELGGEGVYIPIDKIRIMTDSNRVIFDAIRVDKPVDSFRHYVVYTVYISEDQELVKYLKHCGANLLHAGFNNPKFKKFTKNFSYDSQKQLNLQKSIKIDMKGMNNNGKYYGVGVVDYILRPSEPGSMDILRETKLFYDEFLIKNSGLQFSYLNIVYIAFVVGLLLALYIVIKIYIFGDLKTIMTHRNIEAINNITKGYLEGKSHEILSSELPEKNPTKRQTRQTVLD